MTIFRPTVRRWAKERKWEREKKRRTTNGFFRTLKNFPLLSCASRFSKITNPSIAYTCVYARCICALVRMLPYEWLWSMAPVRGNLQNWSRGVGLDWLRFKVMLRCFMYLDIYFKSCNVRFYVVFIISYYYTAK